MNYVTRLKLTVVRLLALILMQGLLFTASGQTAGTAKDPEAFLRYETQGSSSATQYYIEVYMMTPLASGQSVSAIRASLRDTDKKRLLSSAIVTSPEGDANFRIPLTEAEANIIKQLKNYTVFVDSYPTAGGNIDAQIKVGVDVGLKTEPNPACLDPNLPFSITVTRNSDFPYAEGRIEEARNFLNKPDVVSFIAAKVSTGPGHSEGRRVKSILVLPTNSDALGLKNVFACVQLIESPPSGNYELSLDFLAPAPFELRQQQLKVSLQGPTVPSATGEKRSLEDFLDLGLTLTSSVEEKEQEDKTTRRERTTRGVMDLWFAPILNLRRVKTLGDDGGLIQVFTPFYIDAKVATGKITKDTLSVNRINLGSAYEFRHFLNSNAYPDLLRHVLSFQHTSDRDFKQDEVKFTYEFQPIFGAINQPLGSAPDILNDEPAPDADDKFGIEIVPIIGVELGRTYRVRDPKEFEGVSRNVHRFYFGANMTFDLTKHFRLSLSDKFYVRGETPADRGKNYFTGSIEAPLTAIGSSRLRGAHALFLSYERGDQAPFTSPDVNVFKFGYRIRARGLLINTR